MQRVDHHLTKVQVKMLKKMSKKTGLSCSELIRRALDAIYASENQPKKKVLD